MPTNNAINLSDQGVAYYDGAGTFTGVDGSTSGFVLTSNGTGVAPSFQANSAAGAILTITGDSGGAESPSAGNFNLLGGTTGLTFSGTAATETLGGTLVVANGGTGRATGTTAYAPVCVGTTATGSQQTASTGLSTSGNIFASNGSSALPSFQNPASLGGSLVLIQSQSASSSANISFTNIGSYNSYLLIFRSVWAATSTDSLQLVVSADNGSSYANSGYTSAVNYNAYNSTTVTNLNSTTFYPITGPNTANMNISGQMFLTGLNSGDVSVINGQVCYVDSTLGVRTFGNIGGSCTQTASNAIRLLFSSGNIAIGTFTLYGIRQS